MNKKILIGIVLAVAITLFLTSIPPQSGTGVETEASASAILAVSDVTFDNSVPEIGGKDGWIITLAQIPRGVDYALLGFTTLKADGQTATEKVKLETNLDYQECQWDVIRDRDKIVYEVDEVYYQYGGVSAFDLSATCGYPTSNSDSAWCSSHTGDRFVYSSHKIQNSYNCIRVCYALKQKGFASEVVDGVAKSQTTFTLTTSEGEVGKAVLNDDETTDKITYGSKTVGQVQLLGNLWSGGTCDAKVERQQLMAFASTSTIGAQWIPIERQDWNDYRSYDQLLTLRIQNCQNVVSESSCYQGIKSSYNNYASSVQTEEPFFIWGENTLAKDYVEYDRNEGYFYAQINDVVAYPLFRLFVDADFVEIGQLSGMPKILSVDSNCYQSGTEGKIAVEVKNVGTGTGKFEIISECPSPFERLESTETRELAVGATQTVYIDITGGSIAQAKITDYCTITAKDIADPDKQDQATVEMCLEKITTCDSGETRCDGNVVQVCRAGDYEDFKTCDYKCYNGACIDKPTTCGNGICETELGETKDNCASDCIEEPITPPTDYAWIIVLIGFILGGLGGYRLFKSPDDAGKEFYKREGFIAGIIMGIIVAIVFYFVVVPFASAFAMIIPDFNCPNVGGIAGVGAVPDVGCWIINLVKLIILFAIVIIGAVLVIKLI